MKVSLIFPAFPFKGWVPMVPPVLEYLGALTVKAMPDVELELIDANVRDPRPEDIDADLVGISVMTTLVPWAYRLADVLRGMGKKVVLGGMHPTAMPEEAKTHADAVVVGEAESVWHKVLQDASEGALRPFYHGERLSLDDMPEPLTGVLKGPYKFRSVFTMRGCPYKCSFCSVRKFFGDTIRYRPIDKVVAEVEHCTGKVYFNGDDNIWGGSTKRVIELYDELARGSKKHWYGFGDLGPPQGLEGDKLLKSATRSGLFSVWLGWETSSAEGLRMYHASAKQGKDRIDAIRKIKDYGIEVILFVILGGRTDTAQNFEGVLDLADSLGVAVHPVLLTPLPGTELYEEYKPYLIKDKGWEYYTGANAVFEHPTMSPEEREERFYKLSVDLLSSRRIIKHLFEIPLKGFPMIHMISLMKQINMKRSLGTAYEMWKENHVAHDIIAA